MNRRGFLFGLLALSTAFAPLIVRATSLFGRPHYPTFAREGMLLTPYWRKWKRGERVYDVTEDGFRVCLQPHTSLEARVEPWVGPDFGRSVLQLGYKHSGHASPVWGPGFSTADADEVRQRRGCDWDEAFYLLATKQEMVAGTHWEPGF